MWRSPFFDVDVDDGVEEEGLLGGSTIAVSSKMDDKSNVGMSNALSLVTGMAVLTLGLLRRRCCLC